MDDRGRSWKWWIARLADGAEELYPAPRWLREHQLPVYVRNLSALESAAALQACQHYADRREWPVLTEPVATQISVRLRHAIFLAHLLKSQRQAYRAETFSEVFRWFVDDCWAHESSAERWADALAAAERRRRK